MQKLSRRALAAAWADAGLKPELMPRLWLDDK